MEWELAPLLLLLRTTGAFEAGSLYSGTAINHTRVFTTVLSSSGTGNITLSGKSRLHPSSLESNTLLWPVDLRF